MNLRKNVGRYTNKSISFLFKLQRQKFNFPIKYSSISKGIQEYPILIPTKTWWDINELVNKFFPSLFNITVELKF